MFFLIEEFEENKDRRDVVQDDEISSYCYVYCDFWGDLLVILRFIGIENGLMDANLPFEGNRSCPRGSNSFQPDMIKFWLQSTSNSRQ